MGRKIAILGKGNVGKALGEGLRRAGHEVRFGHRDPQEPVDEACAWAEVVVLAVPYGEVGNAVREAGKHLDGKPLVDATNALTEDYDLAIGGCTSGAEQLQRFAPEAKVVKCFNTVFAEHMASGRVNGKPIACFAASDHHEAKRAALELASDLGFDAVDAGPLEHARLLEPMALLNIALAYDLGLGSNINLTLARAAPVEAELEAAPRGAP